MFLFSFFQVETIGDAYMVVSGLPIRNGDSHAAEIAGMALHLIAGVKQDFVVPHWPDHKIELRVGIHSGEFKTSCMHINFILSVLVSLHILVQTTIPYVRQPTIHTPYIILHTAMT